MTDRERSSKTPLQHVAVMHGPDGVDDRPGIDDRNGVVPEQRAVMLPSYRGTLAPAAPERVRRLRKCLVENMRAARERPSNVREAATAAVTPEPAGFRGDVARAACTLCAGWCCRNGGEHAYLEGRDLARVRRERAELDARAILRLYADAAANPSYAGSCVFHGAQGCTLDRSLRSAICNSYFCKGLEAVVKAEMLPGTAIVLSAADGRMGIVPLA